MFALGVFLSNLRILMQMQQKTTLYLFNKYLYFVFIILI